MQKFLKINSYFAHPENIFVTMLHDERREIREVAIQRIRARTMNREELRNYKLSSKINFEAQDYVDMMDWDSELITSLPVLQSKIIQMLTF